ncbi:MAG: SRPBCC family protein [Chloroflexota bacterium]|nr:SRPBCC family protein [Chloroflexota bacterium]
MLINETITISRNPESIWSYWMDVTNDVQWRNGITKAEWTSQPPYGLGSTGEHTHKDMGAMNWGITRFEDGRSFEFIHTAGALKGSIAIFQVEPETNGSRVNVQMRISGPLFMRFMMFFMGKRMRKGVRGDLQKLKELMEIQDTNA